MMVYCFVTDKQFHFRGDLNVAFPPLNKRLIEISSSRFEQYKNSVVIPLFYVLGCFVNLWVIFGSNWKEMVFLEGLCIFYWYADNTVH